MNALRHLKNYYHSLRLPWRMRYLVGTDLQDNTFWEFRDRLNASRPRRTVIFADKSRDWVDYASAVSPQWHQWLRATRLDPPTIAEQKADILRQQQLKIAARLADERWNAKPSLLNAAPHPPADSVLESNTKFCNDSGLQRRQDMGRGEVGTDLGGKNVEGRRSAGESVDRAHGGGGAPVGKGSGEWDPNAMLPKMRGVTRDGVGEEGVTAGEDARRLKRKVEAGSGRMR